MQRWLTWRVTHIMGLIYNKQTKSDNSQKILVSANTALQFIFD